jgi:2-polyprenyl-3-methyl-5-hydroxy-6-metoxy-1,4-benzoquinol methylase
MNHIETNKNSWDQRVETHFHSKFYDVPGFLAGQSSLNEIELAGLPDVKNQTMLHLQCHFGLDSLSWARMGAQVTGVDISDAAIKKANSLKNQANLNAHFVAADVYAYGEQSTQQYDIVFTSYGAVCWMSGIDRWARVVAKKLKPGGRFYMAEFHPLIDLMAGYSYFHKTAPDVELEDTYTENCDGSKHEFAVWTHTISDVISALLKAGLVLKSFKEFDYSPYNCFPNMQEKQSGKYYLEHKGQHVPMVYSIAAIKPPSID